MQGRERMGNALQLCCSAGRVLPLGEGLPLGGVVSLQLEQLPVKQVKPADPVSKDRRRKSKRNCACIDLLEFSFHRIVQRARPEICAFP